MASANPHTILLKGTPEPKEGVATATITPGMLLQVSAPPRSTLPNHAGVRAHATAGADTAVRIARELEYAGGGIDDEYELDDNVPYYVAKSGDEYYALLQAGQSVAAGAGLESAGDGTFRALASGTLLAYARNAVDNDPGTGSLPARIKIEVK
jgi:hypothetical protein